MAKMKDKIITLETQLIDMQRTLEILKADVEDVDEVKIDFAKLEQEAMNNKFMYHPVANCDQEVMYKFCVLLAMVAELSGDNTVRIKQYYHVFRIYHSKENERIADELVRDAKISSIEELSFLKNNVSEELLLHFFVDVLLMFSVDEIQEKQMDFFCEIYAFCGVDKGRMKQICLLAKAILEKKEEMLLQLSGQVDINPYFLYIGACPDYTVVATIKDAESCGNDKVLIYGEKICDRREIFDIDSMGKKKVIFQNCVFDNIIGIKSVKTEVVFDGCRFENCVQEKGATPSLFGSLKYENNNPTTYFMACKGASIINSEFVKCSLLGFGQHSRVFDLEDSIVETSRFDDCQIAVSCERIPTGTVFYLRESSMVNCDITGCTAYGESTYGKYENFCMKIVNAICGKVIGNRFVNCISGSQSVTDECKRNYILVFDNSCKEVNNDFKNCKATQCRWDSNYTSEVKVMQNQDEIKMVEIDFDVEEDF